jgi:hypothetical protein
MAYDANGQPLTASWMDYAPLRASAMPELMLQTVATPSPTNPLGVKGIGSVATVPAPAAVVNAVLDALSHHEVRHLDILLTPRKSGAPGAHTHHPARTTVQTPWRSLSRRAIGSTARSQTTP